MFINLNKLLLLAALLLLATSCQPIGTDAAKKKVVDAVAKEILPTVINFSQKEIFIPEKVQDMQSMKIEFNQDAVAVLSAIEIKTLDISFVTDHPDLISFPKQQHMSIPLNSPIIKSGFILPIQTANKAGKVKVWANINNISSSTKSPIMTANRRLLIADDSDKILSINNRFQSVSLTAYSDFPNDRFIVEVKPSSPALDISSLTKSFNFSFDQVDSPITYQIDYSVSNFDKPQQLQIIASSPKLINATLYPIICWNDSSIQILNSNNFSSDYIAEQHKVISGKIVNCATNEKNIEIGFKDPDLITNKISITPKANFNIPQKSTSLFNISTQNIQSLSELPRSIMIYAKTDDYGKFDACPNMNSMFFISCFNLQNNSITEISGAQFKENKAQNVITSQEHDINENLLVHFISNIADNELLNFRIEYISDNTEQYIVGDTSQKNDKYFMKYTNNSILINGQTLKPHQRYILYAYSTNTETGIQNDIGFTSIS